jgi:hypothetical protein
MLTLVVSPHSIWIENYIYSRVVPKLHHGNNIFIVKSTFLKGYALYVQDKFYI